MLKEHSDRALIIAAATECSSEREIASKYGLNRGTVRRWLKRYRECGIAGLKDLPRPGRAKLDAKIEAAIVQAATKAFPPDAERWTIRSLAKRHHVSRATAHRILTKHGIQLKVCARKELKTGARSRLVTPVGKPIL